MISTKFIAIIPARYASSRFPAKPLAILNGKPVIQWVCERVNSVFQDVVVATDDERIYDCVTAFGGNAVMTRADHRSGTDRCYEAYLNSKSRAEVVVNVQGDEPFIHPEQLETITNCFDDEACEIATLIKPFKPTDTLDALLNPNSPKVVTDKNGYAMYFSRSVIPYLRNVPKENWLKKHTYYKHIGLYAYRAEVLKQIIEMQQTPLELCESLEQLRWLEHGLKIKTALTNRETIGIDTPEDLKRAEQFLKAIQQ